MEWNIVYMDIEGLISGSQSGEFTHQGHLASSGDSVFGCQDSGGSEELLLTSCE